MAKEKEETKKPEGERKQGGKKKLHLHEIRSTQARDGSIVHHHTYKEHPDHPFTMPERGPMATSANPEEAGQHVQDQFAMNQGAGGGDEGAGGQEPEPAAAGAAQGAPQAGA
jgi:hypothetical protein